MSGGYFDYKQHQIDDIASELEKIIENNDNESTDEYGDRIFKSYPESVILEFKNALEVMKKASVYAQRIDWLVSGDDGVASFHERLKEDLSSIQ